MQKKGNILLVANWDSDVGYAWWLMENFWTVISKHYSKKGMKCLLIYPKVTQIPVTIKNSSIKIIECNFRDHSRSNTKKLQALIKENHIKHVYLSDSPTYSMFYLKLRLWGIKKIVVHDHTPGERTPATSWRKLAKSIIQRIPYYTADHFIAVTDYVYQRFIEVSCTPKTKCSIAENGIEPIDTEIVDLKYSYQEFNIPENRFIIITTGRASYYKGIDFFIECANELVNHQDMKQLHFLYCGDGPDMSEFQALVRNCSIENNFTFAGARNNIREILPSCHIGFHSSTGEVGYSLSILEYMSAGLVSVVPDTPSISQATTNLSTGIIYLSRNLESATNAIKLALKPEISNEIKNNATELIKNRFNIQRTNKQLIETLDKLYH